MSFSHDSGVNPMGTDGFEFVEYCAADPSTLIELFELLGFRAVARHRTKNVTLYRQGGINFLVNAELESFGRAFSMVHGPSVCAVGLRVADARAAYKRALSLGAEPWYGPVGPGELHIPAIKGIGGSLIYLVDRYHAETVYDVDFVWLNASGDSPRGCGLTMVDHLTHNVYQGRMRHWARFYEKLFNFREVRYFDIEGKLTGLRSKAMTSPCGKIRIPINESADSKSQIEEFLHAYHGEGIQHIALATDDIYATVESLIQSGVVFLKTPDTYYESLNQRLPNSGEDLERMRMNGILLDGTPGSESGERGRYLLQIFTDTVIGPIFFEIIQRKGDEGFGEGNFQALFDSIERDQLRRGVLVA